LQFPAHYGAEARLVHFTERIASGDETQSVSGVDEDEPKNASCTVGKTPGSIAGGGLLRRTPRLDHRRRRLLCDAIREGMEDETIRNDIDPFLLTVYIMVTSLSVFSLTDKWKKIPEQEGFSDTHSSGVSCIHHSGRILRRKTSGIRA
jgi:hypothetical protein